MNVTKPIVFLDVDTTGLSLKEDRIVRVNLIKRYPNGKEVRGIKLVNPGIPISQEATKIHGISDEDVKDAPKFVDIIDALKSFFEGSDIVGYNIERFDLQMLIEAFDRENNIFNTTEYTIIDLYKVFSKFETRTLSDAYKLYSGKEKECSDEEAMLTIFDLQNEKYSFDNIENIVDKIKDDKQIDLAGKLRLNENGIATLTFGKHRGKPLTSIDKSYLKWMVNVGDFPTETKDRLKELVE